MSRIVLVLGGARSGKSRFAESLAAKAEAPRTYVATSEIFDQEMEDRVRLHAERRGANWTTLEVPIELPDAIASSVPGFVLVECVTIWINNLMHYERNVTREVERLCDALPQFDGTVVLVSNEVGLGIVPDNALARRFRDEAGRANQRLAEIADEVYFVAAGLPLKFKPQPQA
jgi:adenosylcobinamide kinase/adenosylcobinamide-phosphate guanylyltransferase